MPLTNKDLLKPIYWDGEPKLADTSSESLAEAIASLGRTLYGELWHEPLVRDLGVDEQSLRRWLNGEQVIPDTIDHRVWELLLRRGPGEQ